MLKRKKGMKRSCSFLLALVLLFGVVLPKAPVGIQTAEAANQEYTELSLKDFGFAGTYTSNVLGTKTPVTSLDGVAITETITFSSDNNVATNQIRIGAADEGGWASPITIMVASNRLYAWDDAGNKYNLNIMDMNVGQTFTLRMEFNFVDDDVNVLFKVNGTPVYDNTYVGYKSKFGTNVMVLGTGANPVKVGGYKELSFKDFGFDAGLYDNYQLGTAENLSSLDGVAITETIVLPYDNHTGTAGENNDIRIGAADGWQAPILIQIASDTLYFSDASGKGKGDIAMRTNMPEGTTFTLRLEFDVIGEDVKVGTYLDGALACIDTYVGYASIFKPNIMVYGTSANPVQIGTIFNELTLKDFGLAGIYTGNVLGTTSTITSLDGVAITETITFSSDNNAATNQIRIGAADEGGWASPITIMVADNRLYTWDSTTEGKYNIDIMDMRVGQSFTLRLEFKYIDENVNVLFYVDGKLVCDNTYANYKSKFGTKVMALGTGAAPVKLGSYQEMSFADFAIPQIACYEVLFGSAKNIESLDGVAITETIALPYDNHAGTAGENNDIRIGAADGWQAPILIQIASDTLYFSDASGKGKGDIAMRTNMPEGTTFTMRLEFDVIGEDVKVGTYLDGALACVDTYVGYASIFKPNILVYGTVANPVMIGNAKEFSNSVSYDLENGHYLVTGDWCDATGNEWKSGNTISTPGNYTLYKNVAGQTYRQTLSLYYYGDVNLSDGAAETADLEALEAMLEDAVTEVVVDDAAKHAADLDRDGKVGQKDIEIMKQIIGGQITLKAVRDKYYVPALTYDYLGGDDVMPIGGFYGPYRVGQEMDYCSDEIFEMVRDLGINFVNYAPNIMGTNSNDIYAKFLSVMQQANKYGIGYFVTDYALNPEMNEGTGVGSDGSTISTNDIAAQLGKYSYFGNFLGTQVKDEPYPNHDTRWGVVNEKDYSKYARFQLKYYDAIAENLNNFTNLNGAINLVPSDSWVISHAMTNYEQYIDDVLKTNPQMLSFDHYPFANKETDEVTNASSYFTSLWTVSQKAQKNNIPFWGHAQAGGDYRDAANTDGTNTAKQATEAETYWNVNTMLAFGAKGIVWFPLLQPEHFANDSTSETGKDYDRNGLIGSDKTSTPFYSYAKKANEQIAAIDEVLMKAKNTGIIATKGYAYTVVNEGAEAAGTTDIMLNATDVLTKVDTNNTEYGALVGCFDYRDTEAFYVVNYDVTASQEITLQFDRNYDYRRIQNAVSYYETGESCKLTIPAGEAVLIVLEERMVSMDISDYRQGNVLLAPDAEPGYIFAGWYTEAGKSIDSTVKTGNYMAKFVADDVLGVKAQIKAETTRESETGDIRFITTVDSMDYSKVGFRIQVLSTDNSVKTVEFESDKVYRSLKAISNSNEQETIIYSPQYFSTMSSWFKTETIQGIPNEAFDSLIYVTPYWITLDGTKTYGETVTKSISMGLR